MFFIHTFDELEVSNEIIGKLFNDRIYFEKTSDDAKIVGYESFEVLFLVHTSVIPSSHCQTTAGA